MITLTALLFDQFGRVLLSEDTQEKTLVPPSTVLPVGVLPTDALAQAIRETTGIIALPVRLTGLYVGLRGLTLSFRAIQRGGAIRESDGRPVAAFFDAIPAPEPMGATTRQQLDDALHHTGGPPVSSPAATNLMGRLQRTLGRSPGPAAKVWEVETSLVLHDGAGRVWWRAPEGEPYRLPSVSVVAGELPDQAAVALAQLLDTTQPILRSVFLHPNRPVIVFTYAAQVGPNAPGGVWSLPDAPPDDCLLGDATQAAAALAAVEDVSFALLPVA
jgi:hypothetical protein